MHRPPDPHSRSVFRAPQINEVQAEAHDPRELGYCDFRNYRQHVQLINFVIFQRIPHFKMDF